MEPAVDVLQQTRQVLWCKVAGAASLYALV